jgi:hypothetical protein
MGEDMIEILHKKTGAILKTVDAANLMGADLGGADLGGANLMGADLRGAKIRNGIEIKNIPIQIDAVTYNITIFDQHMQIGCEFHSLDEWWSFDDKRITEMGGKEALFFWRKWQVALMAICAANGRWNG